MRENNFCSKKLKCFYILLRLTTPNQTRPINQPKLPKMLTRNQYKKQQEQWRQQQQQEQQQCQQNRAQKQQEELVIANIKSHLSSIDDTSACRCADCKIGKINKMYEYMLLGETERTLLLPMFDKFRVTMITKTRELKSDVLDRIKKSEGKGCITCRTELLERLDEMSSFLEGEQQYTSSKSPTKKVSKQVVLRRSARLMAKYA